LYPSPPPLARQRFDAPHLRSSLRASGVSMPARKRIILLIDDEPQQLSLHEMVLELSGYTVLTASSGRQGLALLSSHHVDEVLLDYEMPQPSHHPFPAFHNPATLHPHCERKAVQVLHGSNCEQRPPRTCTAFLSPCG